MSKKESKIKRIFKATENKNFISGIYNYCDRWCERCSHTDKCMNYSVSQEFEKEKKHSDIDEENEEFWDNLGSIFADTIDFLYEIAEKEGVDLDDITDEDFEKAEIEREKMLEFAEKTKHCKLSEKYFEVADNWFKNSENSFKKKSKQLQTQIDLELPNNDPEKEVELIEELLEVIEWYLHFINIKLIRATQSKMQFLEDVEDNFHLEDANGSAKVAIIATKRSISSWAKLMEIFKDDEDEILDILVVLEKIYKLSLKEFPKAMEFIRPGLDE